jgi:septum site-determining protein MinC
VTKETLAVPAIAIRGRSFMALILAPCLPLADWFAALDQQRQKSAGFFADKPVIANLTAALGADEGPEIILEALEERDLCLIGIEGIDPARLAGTRWQKLAGLGQWRPAARAGGPDRPIAIPDDPPASLALPPAAPAPAESLLIDRPVRSGQSIIFEEGDITIIGSVASGAEVIAGGSIHIYGPLRGRAIAGFRTGAAARIFCRKLLAELISIDGLYSAPGYWSDGFHGKPVQIRHEAGALKFSALD